MAEKTAVFSLKVDTGKSVQDIQAFDKAVEDLNKDLKETSQTATDASTKGMDQFDQKLAELNQRLETGGLTMREMTKLMKEYQNLAAQAGGESPVGSQAIANAANLKDEIGDLKAKTTALSSDFVGLDTALQGVETGAAAFQGIQSAVALTGVESEALTQTMVKLQAVQGLVNSVSIIANNLNKESILGLQLRNGLEKAKNFIMTGSIAPALAGVAATQAQTGANVGLATATGGATTAMKLFRIALISTGIGAIVVAIGLLIANFDKIAAATMKAYAQFDKLGPKIKILISIFFPFIGIIYGTIKALEALGIIDDQNTIKMKANAKAKTDATEKEMNKKISAEKAKAKAVDDNLSFEIRKAQAAGKNTEEMEEKKLQASIKSGRAILKMQKEKIEAYEDELKLLKATGDADSDRYKKIEKSLKEAKKNANEQYKENKKNVQDLTILQIEEDKKRDDANKAAYEKRKARIQKQKDDELKRLKEIAEAEKAANDKRIKEEDDRFALSMELMQAGFEKELQELVIQSEKRMEQAHGDKKLEAQVEMQFQIDKADLIKKYSDIELANLAETEAKKREIREKYTRLFNSDKDNELMDLRDTYESEKDIILNALKANLIDEETYLDRENQLTEKYRKKKAEIDKKYDDIAKEEGLKARKETIANIEKALETAQKYFDEVKKLNEILNANDQNRLDKVASNREADLANLDENLKQQLNQQGLTADQKEEIEKNFAYQKYQIELKAYQEEEKIKKAQFNRDKAIKIGQIAMDTASGVMKAVSASPLTFGLPWSAFTAGLGIAQAAVVANQQYKAGTAPSAPQLGGATAGAGSSEFTANTNAQTTNLTQMTQGQQQGQTTTQVVVLESDISSTQNKVQLQESKSTF